MHFEPGQLVRLTADCKSGMKKGTLGFLVKKCGAKHGGALHFHAVMGSLIPGEKDHENHLVCRNEKKWEHLDIQPVPMPGRGSNAPTKRELAVYEVDVSRSDLHFLAEGIKAALENPRMGAVSIEFGKSLLRFIIKP